MPSSRLLQHAFTLVELAVVLVIIGLIVGGVFLAREMIQQARVKHSVSQIQEYTAAVFAFQDKYNAIPGDIKNASAFGMDYDSAGVATTCQTFGGSVGYNGNGDGLLKDRADMNHVRYDGEIKNFPIHLSNVGMIKDRVARDPDQTDVCSNAPVLGEYPPIKVGTSLLTVSDTPTGMLHFILGGFGDSHALTISNTSEGASTNIANRILTPHQALLIDGKIDDGKPFTGRSYVIIAYPPSSYDDSASGYLIRDYSILSNNCMYHIHNHTLADYNTRLETPVCTLAIRVQ